MERRVMDPVVIAILVFILAAFAAFLFRGAA
jgi:hypothetical protein